MGEGRSGWAEPVRDAVYLTGKVWNGFRKTWKYWNVFWEALQWRKVFTRDVQIPYFLRLIIKSSVLYETSTSCLSSSKRTQNGLICLMSISVTL